MLLPHGQWSLEHLTQSGMQLAREAKLTLRQGQGRDLSGKTATLDQVQSQCFTQVVADACSVGVPA